MSMALKIISRGIVGPQNNSFFLFGPRGAGKTTFLQTQWGVDEAVFVDLLDIQTYDQFLLDPARFQTFINTSENKRKKVVVDEIQKLPRLLDIIHAEIQKNKRQFILTGSSARRLKQQGSNLLAGRAWVFHLYPFSTLELIKSDDFDLKKALERGGLPEAYLSSSNEPAQEYLRAYAGTYLQKEIQQEQWVRKLEPFRKFLAIAAQMNGEIINRSKIARDIGVDNVTVGSYYEILEDTFVGFHLPAFHTSVRKAIRQSPKFYLIDPGIKRALEKTLTVELLPQTSAWGEAFEHWIILEFVKNISYHRLDWDLSYLKTKDGLEIDLIVKRPKLPLLLIEIKSTAKVSKSDFKSLKFLGKELDPQSEKWLISCDPLEQKFDDVLALYWKEALQRLF